MKSLIVAPHPDDELLGCGGTLLRRSSHGESVGWLLMTAITKEKGWSTQRVQSRAHEIAQVREGLSIAPHNFFPLDFVATELDQYPISTLVEAISSVFKTFAPEEVLLPHPGDIHSDHRVTFEAASACTKWFRYPSIKRVLTYETISETDFCLNPTENPFLPNLYVDISDQLDTKLKLLNIYKSELGAHPFPRSLESVRSLSVLRGSQMGVFAAEAFQILRQFE
ncbi:PIG-L deacetylase family protein [Synechococcus sp. N26]|uniref:PIG-L deacetylase family protein n=1 Tax=Synechococcus sp. N26 TaxID=2575513 RepID=UPI000E0F9CF2|nr:PIG-L deacetylase family protein [Synechococcus sp. N26]